MENIYKISELSHYIKSLINNKKLKVCGEVCQPKLSNGHLYFSLKDESSNIKSIIWKSKNINKDNIKDGQKITVDCNLDYYESNNSLNLIINKIVNIEGFGDLYIKYEEIKNDFIKKGYFNNEHKKELPKILKNILVLTSENGAALQDFKINLSNNNSNITIDIMDVIVQGNECPSNICKILSSLKENDIYYDLVIITRGGGSFSDLFGFSQPELIESVYEFHLPVLSAIGHQVDNPLLDLVADVNTPTPSLAAQYIVDHNKNFINNLNNKLHNIKNTLFEEINNKNKQLNKYNEKLYKSFKQLSDLNNIYYNKIKDNINENYLKLKIMDNKLSISPSITLFHKKEQITNNEDLEQYLDKTIKLRWGDREYKIKIIN